MNKKPNKKPNNISTDINSKTNGHITLHRVLLDSSLWQLPPFNIKVAVFLLIEARFSDKVFTLNDGTKIKRGELVTSLDSIAKGCSYYENRSSKVADRRSISRVIKSLETIGFLVCDSSPKGTHISICNYDTYQSKKVCELSDSHSGKSTTRTPLDPSTRTPSKMQQSTGSNDLSKILERKKTTTRTVKSKQLGQHVHTNKKVNKKVNKDTTNTRSMPKHEPTKLNNSLPDNSIAEKSLTTTPPVPPAPLTKKKTKVQKRCKESNEATRLLIASVLGVDAGNSELSDKKRQSTGKRWSEDISKINRLDGRSWEQITEVIKFVADDVFWRKQIRSGSKLRKQFDGLVGRSSCGDISQESIPAFKSSRKAS